MPLPARVAPEARLLLTGRALRAFTDGYVAILLPVYLLALGLGQWEVGLISTATLLGSALMTLAVGQWGHRYPQTAHCLRRSENRLRHRHLARLPPRQAAGLSHTAATRDCIGIGDILCAWI